MAKHLGSILSAAALASAALLGSSCATSPMHRPYSPQQQAQSQPQYEQQNPSPMPLPPAEERADTNTLPISTGSHEYMFKKAKIDEIIVENETYMLLPFSPSMTVESGGKTLDAQLVLDAKFVPYSNSRYVRTPDEVKVLDNGEVYYAANVYHDGLGSMVLNSTNEEKNSFFIVSSNQFPQSITRDELLIAQQRLLENVYRKSGYITIGNERYISLPADNQLGPDRVFIPLSRSKVAYVEERKPDYVKVKYGIDGPGYFLISGTEREMPSREPRVQEMHVKDVEAPPIE